MDHFIERATCAFASMLWVFSRGIRIIVSIETVVPACCTLVSQ